MIINDDEIIAPVSIADLQTILGETSNDLGTLLSSSKINKWAKYKPVIIPSLSYNDSLKSVYTGSKTINNAVWSDTPITTGGNWVWKMPWYMGSQFYKVYEVPEITDPSDIGKNGEQDDTKVWKWNRPTGGNDSPFRLQDMVGYVHSEDGHIRCDIGGSFKIGAKDKGISAAFNFTDPPMIEGEGYFTDYNSLFYDNVYPAIYVRVLRDKKLIGEYCESKTKDLYNSMLDDDAIFDLPSEKFEKQGISIKEGDYLDVRLFLSTVPGQTEFYEGQRFSALFDSDSTVFKRITAKNSSWEERGTHYKVPYTANGYLETIDADYYINMDGDVWHVSKVITGYRGTVDISISMELSHRTHSTQLLVQNYGLITYFTIEDGKTSYNFRTENVENMFTYYSSKEDAEYENTDHGNQRVGIPLCDKILTGPDKGEMEIPTSLKILVIGDIKNNEYEYDTIEFESSSAFVTLK